MNKYKSNSTHNHMKKRFSVECILTDNHDTNIKKCDFDQLSYKLHVNSSNEYVKTQITKTCPDITYERNGKVLRPRPIKPIGILNTIFVNVLKKV